MNINDRLCDDPHLEFAASALSDHTFSNGWGIWDETDIRTADQWDWAHLPSVLYAFW